MELRSPDPACNPYLVFATLLAAGLEGIREKLPAPQALAGNIFELSEEERQSQGVENLPANLWEAVQELKKDEFLHRVLGDHVFRKYVEAKEQEWKRFAEDVSSWEIREYLNKF